MADAGSAYKLITAKYTGICGVCQEPIKAGEPMHWKPKTKRVKHPHCGEPIAIPKPAEPDHGTFGQPLG